MSQASLVVIYILYLIFLIGYFVFSAFCLFHLEEYGYIGDLCRPMTYIYVILSGLIMLITVITLTLIG